MNQSLHIGSVKLDGGSVAELCNRYGVKELSVFGSAGRGELGPESDLDLLVEFLPGAHIGVIKFESLVEELEALTGRKVDLVTKRGLKPWVRLQILSEAQLVYAA